MPEYKPVFAGLPIDEVEDGIVSKEDGEIVDWITEVLREHYWYVDEGNLYIVDKVGTVWGTDSIMRDAMKALLADDAPFRQYELGECLRLTKVPTYYRRFDWKNGFYTI